MVSVITFRSAPRAGKKVGICMIYALLLFAVTYVLMLAFSKYRPYIAIGSAAVFIATRMLPFDQILGAIDFNVLLMIAGTMGLVQLFIDSKMPALLADLIMEKVPNVQMAAVALALTLLWGSAGLSGRIAQTEPTLIERAGTALTEWTDTWPQRWENALSGLSNLFDDFGVSPRNDLTQGGTHP